MGSPILVNRGAKAPLTPLSLTHSDLFTRYLWVGLTVGFDYHLQSTRLEHALHCILDRYPSVAGRCVNPQLPREALPSCVCAVEAHILRSSMFFVAMHIPGAHLGYALCQSKQMRL